eukprot:972873-Prorocentrum_minimum.AAC.1
MFSRLSCASSSAGCGTVLYGTVLYDTVMCCTVLCCTVLYCAVLYGAVLYCTVRAVLYCTVRYFDELYCAVLYCTVMCCTVLCCTVLCCTVLCCTVLCCTVRYCTVLYGTAPHHQNQTMPGAASCASDDSDATPKTRELRNLWTAAPQARSPHAGAVGSLVVEDPTDGGVGGNLRALLAGAVGDGGGDCAHPALHVGPHLPQGGMQRG